MELSPQIMDERDAVTTSNPNIYLNALPLAPALLDIAQLDQREIGFAEHWRKHLLEDGASPLQVYPSFLAAETLQHIHFSARNHERVKGLPVAGFGFPLLLWSQGDELLAAPLFIWQINVSPAPNVVGSWLIGQREERVAPNTALLDFLTTQYSVDLASTLAKAIQNGKITAKALLECTAEVANKLGIENTTETITIDACPTGKMLTNVIAKGGIQWSGVVGIFPPYLPKRTQDGSPALYKIEKGGHDFGLLPLDPYQASALQAIFENARVLIKGTSGTGKTHLLVHLLSNALSNGKRCLVVSENVGALRQIYDQLIQLGLLKYSFLLQDGIADKPMMLNLLRTLANADAPSPAFDESGYRIALDKCKRLKIKLDENYKQLRQPVFGPYNWTETVGLFLRSNRAEGKELLASHLNTQDFTFTFEEFQILQEGIRVSHPLYQKINTLRHPLGNLHEAIFIKQTQQDGLHFITQQTQAFLSKAEKLHHRYINKINAYADWLSERYQGEYGEFANALMRLKDRIADFITQFGTDFEQAGASALRLRGVFSGKYKSVLEARDEIAGHYNSLLKKFEQRPPFDFKFPPAAEGKNMQKVQQNLIDFEKALQRWRESHAALVQEEIQRLNAKNAEGTWNEPIAELEYGLDQLAEELNTIQLYQQSFENKMLTVPKRQKYLEEIIEQLENTRLYLREYAVFYDWQRHWLLVPENTKKIIRALVKVKPNDWLQAFESWYLHNCLQLRGTNAALTVDEKAIGEYVRSYEQLKKLLPGQMAQRWQKNREAALKTLKRNNRQAFQVVFDKKAPDISKDKPLQQLLEPVVDAATAVFPIVLTTPYAAATVLAGLEAAFDYVLLDEAQFLSPESIQTALPLAKQAVFFEDAGKVPLQPESAVSNWASTYQISTYTLQMTHRQNPGNVLQSIEEQEVVDNFNLQFEQVDGRFDEISGTNDEEAQHLIRLLNEVKPTSQRTFPTVGIACFTVEQRDLIASYLLKIKQKWTVGADKIQQLERNGLGVFHLDELQGQHFDVLLVSTVYGIKNAKNELTEQVKHLNQSAFIAQLQSLMSRPLRTLFIANSIPQGHLEKWLEQPQQVGHFLLAHYLVLNQLVVSKNVNKKAVITQKLKDWFCPVTTETIEDVFVQEIATALRPYLGQQRVKTDLIHASLRLPLLIEGTQETQPGLVLLPDGFFATTPATDYVWEAEQHNLLLQQGFIYQSIGAVYWWKNPRQEARKLASWVIKMDKEV